MRFKLCSAFAILLLVGSNDARPPKIASPEAIEEESSSTIGIKDDSSLRPVEPRSSSSVQSDSRQKSVNDGHESKNLRSIDQSLMKVATQLLNVTNLDGATDPKVKSEIVNDDVSPKVLIVRKPTIVKTRVNDKNIDRPNFDEKPTSDVDLISEINSEIKSLESMGIGFGRPTNSKFGYFESSHPGEAMALTEEELERELRTSTTRLFTSTKYQPTTTGGISTWILLNSPTTTPEPPKNNDENSSNDDLPIDVEIKLQTAPPIPSKNLETTSKTDMKIASSESKIGIVNSTISTEKIVTSIKSTTPIVKKTTVTVRPTTTTERSVRTTHRTKIGQTTISSLASTNVSSTSEDVKITTPIVTTKKSVTTNRPIVKTTTPKPANVTSKPMTTKLNRPNQSSKHRPHPSRKSTNKPISGTTKNPNSSKIEKVTFRPVQMITTPKSIVEILERPNFVTKIKTSLFANSIPKTSNDAQSSTTSTINDLENSNVNSNSSNVDLLEISLKPIAQPIKTNNVLKVKLKDPIDPPTTIVNDPIKVSEPISTEIQKNTSDSTSPLSLDSSHIDLKFDFNPELTKVNVEPSTIVATIATTTKRPHKRKKNKTRRRRPTTSSSTTIATTPTTQGHPTTLSPTTISNDSDDRETLDLLTGLGIVDNDIQESKIVSESQTPPNATNNKKKQVQKPIGTQLYNYLSNEVMPSFGVMSLVGLGLGLASYFLYPFGGSIARRNYVVEPNYNYNPDEYGGNYGQNEEEVFSKVLQGMTSHDGRYGTIKDYEKNFHRYQRFDGSYDGSPTTRNEESRYPTPSSIVRRPHETTIYDNKYRNNDFKYADLSTTPNYYDRRDSEFVVKKSVPSDRQFVVGNVPKEYENIESTMDHTVRPNYQVEIAQNNHKLTDDANKMAANAEERPDAQALRASDGYEDVEITPTAVAVEHGPRSLNHESTKSRRKRESVIQLIPSRTEIEMEEREIEKEEPLSNEIIDIIDSVITEDTVGNVATTTIGNVAKKIGNVAKAVDKIAVKHNDKRNGETSTKDDESDEKDENRKTKTTEATVTSTRTTDLKTTKAKVDEDEVTTLPTDILDETEVPPLTIDEIIGATTNSGEKNADDGKTDSVGNSTTTEKPQIAKPFNLFSFVKKIAEVKFKLGIAILKHASEGLARYLGHVQKRVNGEE